MKKVGRNEPCPCGSGKKYKHCHEKVERKSRGNKKLLIYLAIFIVLISLGVVSALMTQKRKGPPPGPAPEGKVWSEEHQHYH